MLLNKYLQYTSNIYISIEFLKMEINNNNKLTYDNIIWKYGKHIQTAVDNDFKKMKTQTQGE